MTDTRFLMAPPEGTLLLQGGQTYRAAGAREHLRRDGTLTTLIEWEGRCAECGEPFTCASPLEPKHLNRRCHAHRKPGIRVRKARGKNRRMQEQK